MEIKNLPDDIEYIIIQEENPNNLEDTSGNIIAVINKNGIEVIKDYMVRTKFKDVHNENHTLEEVRQKLINYLFKAKNYDEIDTKLIEILFKYKKD